ncbi:uncharacterized protein LY89DRAFT_728315 [Mollisia scopiformis]|uniref:Uncharacterized protein n=1 Tax=Mollisia scopiformis TaxID=149040 RepID=A0A194XU70_MOLSC|nr:uncharacterized protein LY89DRAFT_728315 [Mollisia scopiformis]KUJ23584.1 hypothetical protein LY89DRAFT_728315 [Mollisia scopiformis]
MASERQVTADKKAELREGRSERKKALKALKADVAAGRASSLNSAASIAAPPKEHPKQHYHVKKKRYIRKWQKQVFKSWRPEAWSGEATYRRWVREQERVTEAPAAFELDGEDGWEAGDGWDDHEFEVETDVEDELVCYEEEVECIIEVDEDGKEICVIEAPGEDDVVISLSHGGIVKEFCSPVKSGGEWTVDLAVCQQQDDHISCGLAVLRAVETLRWGVHSTVWNCPRVLEVKISPHAH